MSGKRDCKIHILSVKKELKYFFHIFTVSFNGFMQGTKSTTGTNELNLLKVTEFITETVLVGNGVKVPLVEGRGMYFNGLSILICSLKSTQRRQP